MREKPGIGATDRVILAGVGLVLVVGAAGIGLAVLVPRQPFDGQASPAGGCEASSVMTSGAWKGVGGGGASFWLSGRGPDGLYASPWAWLIWVRFDPAVLASERVTAWADHLGSSDRVVGFRYVEPYRDPGETAPSPPPQLAGGSYPFSQLLPVPGCWQLSAAIDGRVAGTAIVDVAVGTPRRVPTGTHVLSGAPVDGTCFAFESTVQTYLEPTAVQAWWDMGASDDCTTRTSDVVATRARIEPRADAGYDLVLQIPLMSGETREIRVALHVLGAPEAVDALIAAQGGLTPLGGILSAGHASVFFNPVEEVDPEFAPRG